MNVIGDIILEDIKETTRGLRREDFEGRKVLVTGGAGLIGSWIYDVPVGLDAEVACLDDLSTGRLEYVDHLVGSPDFEFLSRDICTFKDGESSNLILHLANHTSFENINGISARANARKKRSW